MGIDRIRIGQYYNVCDYEHKRVLIGNRGSKEVCNNGNSSVHSDNIVLDFQIGIL